MTKEDKLKGDIAAINKFLKALKKFQQKQAFGIWKKPRKGAVVHGGSADCNPV